MFLKILQISMENTCVGGPHACNFIKKRLQHKYFPLKFLRIIFSTEQLRWMHFKIRKSKGKDTLWNFSFRVFNEINFQGHFMKYEILSWNTFTLVSKFYCVSHSQKKCDIYCNKRYSCINYAAPHIGLQ